jgi:hypothetical protein
MQTKFGILHPHTLTADQQCVVLCIVGSAAFHRVSAGKGANDEARADTHTLSIYTEAKRNRKKCPPN